jgi:hypothetical protein
VEEQILNKNLSVKEQALEYRTLLVVIRYPKFLSFLGFLSMALFHFPLFFKKNIRFYKLMGTGKNGSFDIVPDLSQWSIILFFNKAEFPDQEIQQLSKALLGNFILSWLKLFNTSNKFLLLEPYAGHGSWDGNSFVQNRKSEMTVEGRIGVLTRASIRLNRLAAFWKAVPSTSKDMDKNDGFVYSIGIGEIPLIKQATFSIWESETQMKNYAYKMRAHQEVIKITRAERWYSEEMFLRFKIIKTNPEFIP